MKVLAFLVLWPLFVWAVYPLPVKRYTAALALVAAMVWAIYP